MVADNFKFGADKSIIVALEQNVLMASKKDMLKVRPSRKLKHAVLMATAAVENFLG